MGTPYVPGPFRLDAQAGILFRGDEPVALGRRAVAVLRALVERAGIPVSKDALIDAAWAGLSVEESNLAVQIAALRRVFGSEPGGGRWIETLPGRGYRFVGPADIKNQGTVAARSFALVTPAASESSREESVRPHLSIVVLPFVNIGGDPEQDYFVDGVTESLTTDLSRISGAFVIARNTAFTLKGKPFDVTAIGRELNVRYVLEGSVQRGGNRLRVNVQLIDAESGNHLWADRFDKPVADYLEMQDEIVARLAGQLGTELIAAEARRAENALNPDASALRLQASAWLNKGPSRRNLAKARDFLGRALAIEPDNVEALVGCAFADIWEATDFASPGRSARLAAAETSLWKALRAAPNHAKAHLALSYVKIHSNYPAQGVVEAERALVLDRNLAEALVAVGYAKLHVGCAEEMEGYVQRALRLSPHDTFAFLWMSFAGAAKLHLGAYEAATTWLSQSVTANSNFPAAHFLLAASLGQLGRIEEARAEAEAGLALTPEFTVSGYRDGAKSDNPIFLNQRLNIYDGLRTAGVPEGPDMRGHAVAAAPPTSNPRKPAAN
jgi:TolB-like protein/tetratricopeptide (TPR) repeat protein